jgi:hypothetical protein
MTWGLMLPLIIVVWLCDLERRREPKLTITTTRETADRWS